MIQRHLATLFVLTGLAAGSAHAQIICEPGQNGVIPCPCSDKPSGPGRGCNNSLNTGGTALSATGSPSLSADNIQFHCTGIGTLSPSCSNPNGNVLCGLYEATLPVSTGSVWNDGVICCTGTFYPLDIQVSAAGSYHWPVPGTTAVSSTAISLGDALLLPGVPGHLPELLHAEPEEQVEQLDPDLDAVNRRVRTGGRGK